MVTELVYQVILYRNTNLKHGRKRSSLKNGHVGEGNRDGENVMSKFGVKDRNLEGQAMVDFTKTMEMAVVNTFFQKREEPRVTLKCGGRSTQICRRGNLREIRDCNYVAGESVAKQHQIIVCKVTMKMKKRKCVKTAENQVVQAKERGMV